MKRDKLESFLGKKVKITFIDYCYLSQKIGSLCKTDDERYRNDPVIHWSGINTYTLENEIGENIIRFKCSHVKKCELVE